MPKYAKNVYLLKGNFKVIFEASCMPADSSKQKDVWGFENYTTTYSG